MTYPTSSPVRPSKDFQKRITNTDLILTAFCNRWTEKLGRDRCVAAYEYRKTESVADVRTMLKFRTNYEVLSADAAGCEIVTGVQSIANFRCIIATRVSDAPGNVPAGTKCAFDDFLANAERIETINFRPLPRPEDGIRVTVTESFLTIREVKTAMFANLSHAQAEEFLTWFMAEREADRHATAGGNRKRRQFARTVIERDPGMLGMLGGLLDVVA